MMFKQLDRLQRYTFLHELSSYAYTFLHELSSYYVHDNLFQGSTPTPILFIMIEPFHILPQFLVERMLSHRFFVA